MIQIRTFEKELITHYRTGKGHLPSEFAETQLAIETTWTLLEIRQQPAWFIERIMMQIRIKNKESNRAYQKQAKAGK
jgi:hypothetical protein